MHHCSKDFNTFPHSTPFSLVNRIYLGYRSQSAAKVSVLISVQLIWNALKSDERNLTFKT